jgi:hypothetical protein
LAGPRPTVTIPSYHFVHDKKLLKTVLRQAGQEVAKIDRALLRASGSGRKYGRHVASAPGAASAKLSGLLAKSVKVKVSKSGSSVRIIEDQYYAKFLEIGAKGGGRRKGGGKSRTRKGVVKTRRVMAPRPSLHLAYAKVAGNLEARIKAALKGTIAFKPAKAAKK